MIFHLFFDGLGGSPIAVQGAVDARGHRGQVQSATQEGVDPAGQLLGPSDQVRMGDR